MVASLCQFCVHQREIVTGKGSRFILCRKSATDDRFPKYPPQPVLGCSGFEPTTGAGKLPEGS
jgi:hypothetical protein